MYSGNPYQLQQAFQELARHGQDRDHSVTRAALRLYRRTRRHAWLVWLRSTLSGRGQRLLDLHQVEASYRIGNRCAVGCRTVALRQIRGSEERCRDFDANFRPLQSHCADRWLGVAIARKMGMALPPVDLIQVGDIYFVRDGHHRISVARALGQAEIEAEVTVWHMASTLAPFTLDPEGVGRTAWLAPRFRPALGQMSHLLVAFGGRLVARGLPPYHPPLGEAGGKQQGALIA